MLELRIRRHCLFWNNLDACCGMTALFLFTDMGASTSRGTVLRWRTCIAQVQDSVFDETSSTARQVEEMTCSILSDTNVLDQLCPRCRHYAQERKCRPHDRQTDREIAPNDMPQCVSLCVWRMAVGITDKLKFSMVSLLAPNTQPHDPGRKDYIGKNAI